MTRKEVCKATGLSVKTLRLYEEKGLIAPAKDWRNGREYREYTPELVAQLKQIIVLRRALFTMDEIKTMQEHPETIPAIFRNYQLWLESQEQQFHRLRQAADHIHSDDLSSLDGLLSGLQGTAETMPLPAMDVKPNFGRLDEIEEGPRLVQPQENFDEMVPDAKVFRQMNLVMDRDKANNINIAFGQYNQLRQELSQPVESGAVQRDWKRPTWLKILSWVLLVLFLACVAAARITRSDTLETFIRVPLVVLVVLEAATVAIPPWLEHRKWLKSAQQSDMSRQQTPDASAYKKERRKRRKIAAACTAGGLVVVALIVLLCRVLYVQAHPATDYRVCFASPANIYDKDLRAMEDVLAPLVGDRDGNGKLVVDVDLLQVRGDIWIHTESGGDLRSTDYLQQAARDGEYTIYLIPDLTYMQENICTDFRFPESCQPLPDDLRALPGSTDYRVNLTGTKLFAAADLQELPVYGCISQAATQEEYDLAVALLRAILAQ